MFLPLPIIIIDPSLTIEPKTASTVVALTSGNILHISAFDIGVKLFNIVASILAFFVILLLFTTQTFYLVLYNTYIRSTRSFL